MGRRKANHYPIKFIILLHPDGQINEKYAFNSKGQPYLIYSSNLSSQPPEAISKQSSDEIKSSNALFPPLGK